MRENRRTVGLAVLGVKLMGELVKDDVVAVVDVRRTRSNIVPRQDDGSLFPGLAEAGLYSFGDDLECTPQAGHVGPEIDTYHGADVIPCSNSTGLT